MYTKLRNGTEELPMVYKRKDTEEAIGKVLDIVETRRVRSVDMTFSASVDSAPRLTYTIEEYVLPGDSERCE